jgi:hypothetical protein
MDIMGENAAAEATRAAKATVRIVVGFVLADARKEVL